MYPEQIAAIILVVMFFCFLGALPLTERKSNETIQ